MLSSFGYPQIERLIEITKIRYKPIFMGPVRRASEAIHTVTYS